MKLLRQREFVKPVFGERALMVEDALIVADLHLGLESALWEKGIKIKPQWDETHKRLFDLIDAHKAERLIILGDIKHNIPTASWQEYKLLPRLMRDLSESLEVVLIKGNHDGLLEKLLDCNIKIVKSIGIGKALLAHGHMNVNPSGFEYLILGHNHPSVELRDEMGYGVREPAWVRLKLNELGLEYFGLSRSPEMIIVPAFNVMLPGNPFNSNGKLLGPLFNNKLVDLENGEIFLLDGTSLGCIRDLRNTT